MPVQCNTVLYPVRDLDKTKAVFAALFGDPHVDSPFYVGFSASGTEIGLVPAAGEQDMTGPVPFFDVEDVSATLAALQAVGGQILQEPTDVAAGLLVAKIADADGNQIGLRQVPIGA
jgi:predicted enzyme related to lactoylglutathione lyase